MKVDNRTLGLVAVLLAIPQAAESIVGLAGRWDWLGEIAWPSLVLASVLAAAWLVRRSWPRIREPLLRLVIRTRARRWLDDEQDVAANEASNYSDAVARQAFMLEMTPLRLARRAKIPLAIAWVYLSRPELIACRDLHSRLERAFFMRLGSFASRDVERSYGDALTQERLIWYSSHDLACSWTKEEIIRAMPKARRDMLILIESIWRRPPEVAA